MDDVMQEIRALRAKADRLERRKNLEDSLPRCPFCKGNPSIVQIRGDWDDIDKGTFYVLCLQCGCRTADRKSESDAVADWSRRYG